jgi:4-hydroxy-tetrahydrodipicolinate reductase
MSTPTDAPIRAVVYGVGEMGVLLTRLLLEKGVDIVGAVARSRNKVGQDLGEAAGLGRRLGVTITDEPGALLDDACPDIAVMAVCSTLEAMAPHFRTCLSRGVNVVTLEEETFYPWRTSPTLAAELDTLGRSNCATLTASGAQDVYWSLAVSALMATAHRVDGVRGRSTWHGDQYGPEVAERLYIGENPEAASYAAAASGWGAMIGRTTLEALAAFVGLSPIDWEAAVTPVVAAEGVYSDRLNRTIAKGAVLGMAETVKVQTAEGIGLEFEMAGFVHAPGQTLVNEWWVDGEPDLHMLNDDWPGRMITCATVVNRIPDVIAAPPGLVTVDRLPLPRYRPGALRRPRGGRGE